MLMDTGCCDPFCCLCAEHGEPKRSLCVFIQDLTHIVQIVPDNECFKGNVLSTYNVIEAACKLGVKKIVIASSETTYGVCFAQGDDSGLDYHSFPLEEDYDVDPMDSYALSKICGEKTARVSTRHVSWLAIPRPKNRIADIRSPIPERHLCAEDRQRYRAPRI